VETAKAFGQNVALAGLPVAAGKSALTRIATGAGIGAGQSAAISALSGQPQDTAQNIIGAVQGAAFGAIPHENVSPMRPVPHPNAEPGSLSDAANVLDTSAAQIRRPDVQPARPPASRERAPDTQGAPVLDSVRVPARTETIGTSTPPDRPGEPEWAATAAAAASSPREQITPVNDSPQPDSATAPPSPDTPRAVPDWARDATPVVRDTDRPATTDGNGSASSSTAGDAVGIANAAKADERARRNLGPLDAEGKRDFGQVWERARQTLMDDPQAGNRLADDLVQSPRALNAEESAVLIQHGADLNNRYDRALKDIEGAQKSGDTASEADAQVRRRELEEQLSAHDQAARQSGYEQGLGLSIRQAMAKRDYSMARQVARFRAIEGGDVPEGTRANLERMTKQIADLNEQIKQRDEQTAKQAATTRAKRPTPQTAQEQHEQLKTQLARLFGKQDSQGGGEISPPSNVRRDAATPPRAPDTSSAKPATAALTARAETRTRRPANSELTPAWVRMDPRKNPEFFSIQPPQKREGGLLDAVAKGGGLNLSAFKSQYGSDPAILRDRTTNNKIVGKPLFRKNGGMTPDQLREMLQQHGWMPADHPNAPPQYSMHDAYELVDRALRGENVLHPADAEHEAVFRHIENQQNDYLRDMPAAKERGFPSVEAMREHDANESEQARATNESADRAQTQRALDESFNNHTSMEYGDKVPFARRGSVGGLGEQEVNRLASRVLGVDADKANVGVVRSTEQLPQAVREYMQAQGVPAEEVSGVHWRGKSWIVADKMRDAAHVQETVFHEHYTHGGLRARYGTRLEGELKKLLRGVGGEQGVIDLAKQQGIDLSPYLRTKESPTVLMEELLAHMSKLTGTLKRVVQEWVGALRNWLRANGYAELAKYNETDLAHVLKQARQAVREKAGLSKGVPMFQRTFADAMAQFKASAPPTGHDPTDAEIARALHEDAAGKRRDRADAPALAEPETAGLRQRDLDTPRVVAHAAMAWRNHGTNSPYFKRWFGDSKAVDAAGKPLVVHHGTADEFNVFEDRTLGKNTGHMTAPLGHFFTESRAEAQKYAVKASDGVPADERVIDAYLSIQKPKAMTLDQFMAIDSQDEARALRAKLQAQGYDGIKLAANGKTQWIAFKSEQAKSAGNRGTFDETNPDIRYSRSTSANPDDVAAIVKKMARNRVAAGETDPRALIDWLHGEVGGLTGLSRQEVHGIVAGTRSGSAPTKSELQMRANTIRAQLRRELKNPEAQRNATRQVALHKQIEDLQRRIVTGDFSKAKREPFTYNENTFVLEAQRNRLQRQVDALATKREQAQKNPAARFADFLLRLHRFNILSSPHTIPKLLSAAAAKVGVTPLEEVAGSALRTIPGIRQIAAMAPRHGAGFTLGAEREALRGAFSKETLRGMRDQILHGHDTLDELYGDKLHKTAEWTNFMGNIHSALKEPAMLSEFYRSYFLRAQHARAGAIGDGMTPAEADAYMQRPSTQAMLSAKAYADGTEAKMQGKNQLADAIDSMLRTAQQQGGPMGAFAKVFNLVFPIRKVPLNIVKDMTSYAVGGVKAGIGAATWRTDMTPEQADYILKNLKKQSVGLALLTLGYAFSQSFGGTHQPGDSKRQPNVKPGEAKIGGVGVPELYFHSPAAQTVQIGAGLARLYHQEYGKTHDGFMAGLHALLDNYGSTLERGVPYLDQPRRIGNTLRYGRGAGEVLGNQVRSMVVPQFVQTVAQARDPYKGFRKPKNIAQDVELGVPGMRETVPK